MQGRFVDKSIKGKIKIYKDFTFMFFKETKEIAKVFLNNYRFTGDEISGKIYLL